MASDAEGLTEADDTLDDDCTCACGRDGAPSEPACPVHGDAPVA